MSDKYRRVDNAKPKQEEGISKNEIRITTGGRVKNYISYAVGLFQSKTHNAVVLKAMGRAINKTVTIAELLKRKIAGLHQITHIDSTDITDVWEPIEEGLDRIETTRHVSSITITLSVDPLDTNDIGYQPPLPADQFNPNEPIERIGGGRRPRGPRPPRAQAAEGAAPAEGGRPPRRRPRRGRRGGPRNAPEGREEVAQTSEQQPPRRDNRPPRVRNANRAPAQEGEIRGEGRAQQNEGREGRPPRQPRQPRPEGARGGRPDNRGERQEGGRQEGGRQEGGRQEGENRGEGGRGGRGRGRGGFRGGRGRRGRGRGNLPPRQTREGGADNN